MAELDTPIIDPRNETTLVDQALTRTFNASGGTINDLSSSSVARVLIEGLAFAGAELLYYVNKLPLAVVVEFLKVAGITRREGTAAQATLTFTLSAPLATPFTIPAGFQATSTNGVSFLTDTQLIIPAGSIEGTVTATAEVVGSSGNLAAFTITNITQALSFLSGVINLEAAAGGTDAETQDQAIARGLVAIRLRNLVSGADYEQAAINVLGQGSVAHAIGLLGQDKISYQLGAVHLFCLNANGDAPNTTQLSAVSETLSPRIQIGTSLYVSSLDVVDVDVDLVASLREGQNPNTVAEALWAALQRFLDPTKVAPGQTVILKEVEYNLRLQGGIKYIQAATLNGETTNLPMPFDYSVPSAHSLFCTFVDVDGTTFRILKGSGEAYV